MASGGSRNRPVGSSSNLRCPKSRRRLALIFADLISNLKATLDHIACALVDQRGTCDQDTYFSVVDERKDWKSAVGGKLKGFPTLWLQVWERSADAEVHRG